MSDKWLEALKYAIYMGDIDEFCQAEKEIVEADTEDKRNGKKK